MRRLMTVILTAATLALATPAQAAERGDTGQDVKVIQYQLRSLGYALAVDGVFGLQTDKAVRSWQKSNGLIVDGIAGPATAASLTQATRLDPPAVVYGPPPGLSACDEMSWYRQQAGLPEVFDAIGYRESRCDNGARATTAVARRYRGWWSVGVAHINNRVYGPGAAACGINDESDYYGTSPAQKRASACFAKVLYDHSGMQPWATN